MGLFTTGCSSTNLVTKGDKMMNNGQYSMAILQYEKAAKKSDSYESHLKKGLAHYRVSDLAKANDGFSNAIKVEPVHSSLAYYYRAQLNYAVDIFRALNDVNEALIRDSQNVQALNLRGRIYVNSSDYAKAVQDFSAALLLTTSNSNIKPYLFHNRALAYIEKGDYIAAKEDFAQYIRFLQKNNIDITEDEKYLVGVLEYGTGDYDEALKIWEDISLTKQQYAMEIVRDSILTEK